MNRNDPAVVGDRIGGESMIKFQDEDEFKVDSSTTPLTSSTLAESKGCRQTSRLHAFSSRGRSRSVSLHVCSFASSLSLMTSMSAITTGDEAAFR